MVTGGSHRQSDVAQCRVSGSVIALTFAEEAQGAANLKYGYAMLVAGESRSLSASFLIPTEIGMNRLILVRHGGSTANEDRSFYAYNDSAICLTTNGIRQALNTGGVLKKIDKRWQKPGNFGMEVFASEYFRAQQTARIVLDEMGLLSARPSITALLNERDYGTKYLPIMDSDPYCVKNGSESSVQARERMRGFLKQITPILPRADVFAFSHMGAIRALIAELLGLSDHQMMKRTIENGRASLFDREPAKAGQWRYAEGSIADHVLRKKTDAITPPPKAPPDPSIRALTRGGPGIRK